jgi:hypothetical protein
MAGAAVDGRCCGGGWLRFWPRPAGLFRVLVVWPVLALLAAPCAVGL